MRTVIRPVVALLATLGAAAGSDRVLTEPDMRRGGNPAGGNRGNSDAALFSHFSAGGPAAGLRVVASGLVSPVDLVEAPDGTGRLFVVDQIGVIRIITNDGTLLPTPFLDVRSRMVTLNPVFDERGLLGLAFHPNFATNGRFFVYYNAPPRLAGFDNIDRLSEFRAAAGANVADHGSERIILEIDDPQFNHNGGTITFGPADGFLYWAIGDGGGANDVGFGHVEDWYPVNAGGNGQDIEQNLLGNILRIDVNGALPYAIPADNPFVDRLGRDEIWAYGLRNPYRMSFDMEPPHILLAGDAGQRLAEEVSVIVRGGNYGWNVKEGLYCFNAANNLQPLPTCPSVDPTTGEPLRDPVIAYPNASNPFVPGLGVTVIGGYVYRGDMLPQFRGRYIFADFSESAAQPDGQIFIAKTRDIGGTGLWGFQEIHFPKLPGQEIGHYVKGFGQDLDGEVYILGTLILGPTGTTGKVFQLTKVSGQPGGLVDR
jgi:glucose/arabinose dehydrogenase